MPVALPASDSTVSFVPSCPNPSRLKLLSATLGPLGGGAALHPHPASSVSLEAAVMVSWPVSALKRCGPLGLEAVSAEAAFSLSDGLRHSGALHGHRRPVQEVRQGDLPGKFPGPGGGVGVQSAPAPTLGRPGTTPVSEGERHCGCSGRTPTLPRGLRAGPQLWVWKVGRGRPDTGQGAASPDTLS